MGRRGSVFWSVIGGETPRSPPAERVGRTDEQRDRGVVRADPTAVVRLDSDRQVGSDDQLHGLRDRPRRSPSPHVRPAGVLRQLALAHPAGRFFRRFWETVRAALAPAGRVFFADELEGAWRHDERFRESFADDPSVPVVRRSLPDGRTFRVVKVFWSPEELRSRLASMAWDVVIQTAGPFLWAEALPRDRPQG